MTRLPAASGRARFRIESAAGVDVRPLLAARIATEGWALYAFTPVEASLEDAFLGPGGADGA